MQSKLPKAEESQPAGTSSFFDASFVSQLLQSVDADIVQAALNQLKNDSNSETDETDETNDKIRKNDE